MTTLAAHTYQLTDVTLAVEETLITPIPSFGHGWVANITSCITWLAGSL